MAEGFQGVFSSALARGAGVRQGREQLRLNQEQLRLQTEQHRIGLAAEEENASLQRLDKINVLLSAEKKNAAFASQTGGTGNQGQLKILNEQAAREMAIVNAMRMMQGKPPLEVNLGQFGNAEALMAGEKAAAEREPIPEAAARAGATSAASRESIPEAAQRAGAIAAAEAPFRQPLIGSINVGPQGIDYGDPPAGMAWARNPDGSVKVQANAQGLLAPVAVPIIGGEMEAERAAGEEAAAGKQAREATTTSIVSQDIGRAIQMIEGQDFPPVTGVGSLLSGLPEPLAGGARNLSSLLDTIKANVGFDKLQAIRAASPTGGALGPVSDFENRLMQATAGSLDQAQDKKQLIFNLRRVEQIFNKIVNEGITPGQEITLDSEAAAPPPPNQFTGMSPQELQSIDPASLSIEDLKAYIEALRASGRGQ